MPLLPRPELNNLPAVTHGGPYYSDLQRLGLSADRILDFSVCCNPYPPPAAVRKSLQGLKINLYPDSQSLELRSKLSHKLGVPIENILAGNGSTELIRLIASAYFNKGDRVLIPCPTYGEYALAARIAGAEVINYQMEWQKTESETIKGLIAAVRNYRPKAVFLCNPNNPTGQYFSRKDIESLVSNLGDTLLILDEAYINFLDTASVNLTDEPRLNVLDKDCVSSVNAACLNSAAKSASNSANKTCLRAISEERPNSADKTCIKAISEERLNSEDKTCIKAISEERLNSEAKTCIKAVSEQRPDSEDKTCINPISKERLNSEDKTCIKAISEERLNSEGGVWSSLSLIDLGNIIFLRSLTKDYGLAGLRLGYAIGRDNIITTLRLVCPPWNVNSAAQQAGMTALEAEAYLTQCQRRIRQAKIYLIRELNMSGFTALPSKTNFFLLKMRNVKAFSQTLMNQGILVRDCTSFGLPEYVRLAPRTLTDCRKLIGTIKILNQKGEFNAGE